MKPSALKPAVASLALSVVCMAALLDASPQAPGPERSNQQAQPRAVQFGEAYEGLGEQRQKLVADWVARVNELTGQRIQPEPFYDTKISLSTKTTFDAVTNALLRTELTDSSGASHSTALDLVERVEAVRGQVLGASGDHQFRLYVRLTEDAVETLERTREFKRRGDNTVFHRGYPINYRSEGGTPSIQISVATDRRRADIDVDYRSPGFPQSLFNGHLTASNSDVRAGTNYDRHTNRWSGFQNWWRSIFGVSLNGTPAGDADKTAGFVPARPRAGDKSIDVMVDDFLRAWLVEGDAQAALGYVSERAYACLAEDGDDGVAFDKGLAPLQLMLQLKAAHDALGPRDSIEGLVVGVRLTRPGLKVVRQPHHAQFVVYSVPDDIAAAFDCESRLTLAEPKRPAREYGRYLAATFYIDGRKDHSMALLWTRDNGFWKIVSWQAEPTEDATVVSEPPPVVSVPDRSGPREKADPMLVQAARDFLESWLVRKDYDAAFRYLAPASYACYNLERSASAPAATSPAEAAQAIRAALESVGKGIDKPVSLESLLLAVPPAHPMVRPLTHPYSQTFSLSSVPNAISDAADCALRARSAPFGGEIRPEYGKAYAMNFRFRTQSGETPVLRLLWAEENGTWRITVYNVEAP